MNLYVFPCCMSWTLSELKSCPTPFLPRYKRMRKYTYFLLVTLVYTKVKSTVQKTMYALDPDMQTNNSPTTLPTVQTNSNNNTNTQSTTDYLSNTNSFNRHSLFHSQILSTLQYVLNFILYHFGYNSLFCTYKYNKVM